MTYPAIAYSDEAGESWDTAIQRLDGYVVGLHRASGAMEDVVVVGTDNDEDGWMRLLYRAYDHEGTSPDWPAAGPILAIRTDEFTRIEVF